MKKYLKTLYEIIVDSSYIPLLVIFLITMFRLPFVGSIQEMNSVLSIGLQAMIGILILSVALSISVYLVHTIYLLIIKATVNPEFPVEEHLYDVYIKG